MNMQGLARDMPGTVHAWRQPCDLSRQQPLLPGKWALLECPDALVLLLQSWVPRSLCLSLVPALKLL